MARRTGSCDSTVVVAPAQAGAQDISSANTDFRLTLRHTGRRRDDGNMEYASIVIRVGMLSSQAKTLLLQLAVFLAQPCNSAGMSDWLVD
jgi:hypothetical protein